MRRSARLLLVLGVLAAVVGFAKVHAVSHDYDLTSSARIGWSIAYVGVMLIAAYAAGLPSLSPGRNKLLVSAGAGIARALQNRWLLGNAAYRDPSAFGAVDTVYLGAFRSAEARAIRYDERLDANEDFDLCHRYRDRDATVWLDPDLDVRYEPRRTWDELFSQYQSFGRAKVHMWQTTASKPNPRQYASILAAGGAVVVLAAGLRSPAILLAAHVAIELGWLIGIAGGVIRRPARAPAT